MRIKAIALAFLVSIGLVGGMATAASASPRHHHSYVKPVLSTGVNVVYSTGGGASTHTAYFQGRAHLTCGMRFVDWSFNDRAKLYKNGREIESVTLSPSGAFSLTDTNFSHTANYTIRFGGRPASHTHYGLRPSLQYITAAELAVTY